MPLSTEKIGSVRDRLVGPRALVSIEYFVECSISFGVT